MRSPHSNQLVRLGYLFFLTLGSLFSSLSTYQSHTRSVIWGQPISVLITFIFFALAGLVWLSTPRNSRAPRQIQFFLVSLVLAWLVHWLLSRHHGDAFNYTGVLYVPILVMILLKPPTVAQIRIATLTFSWTVSLILLGTWILERFGALQVRTQPQGVIRFDEERYFLPFNDLLGIDGRWPGPFGHNGVTSMMAALLIVLAAAFWTRSSWLFLSVGALTLVLTEGRASIGAVGAGLIVLWMFSRSRRLAWAPQWTRILTGVGILVSSALILFLRPAGLTGRERIWPAFLQVWLESPWVGVGGAGFAAGNQVTQQFGHAHSLYIEELARYGLIGFVAQFAALSLGIFIAGRAAQVGYPGPLAVITAYLVTGITEPRNNWIEPSAVWILLLLMVLAASAHLSGREKRQAVKRASTSSPEDSAPRCLDRT